MHAQVMFVYPYLILKSESAHKVALIPTKPSRLQSQIQKCMYENYMLCSISHSTFSIIHLHLAKQSFNWLWVYPTVNVKATEDSSTAENTEWSERSKIIRIFNTNEYMLILS